MYTLSEMYITKVMLLDSFSANIETLNAFFSFCLVYAHTYGLKKKKKEKNFTSNYRLIILRKSLLFNILSKDFTDFSTKQYCHVVFLFKLFDKMVNKKEFLKISNLYVESVVIPGHL